VVTSSSHTDLYLLVNETVFAVHNVLGCLAAIETLWYFAVLLLSVRPAAGFTSFARSGASSSSYLAIVCTGPV
jgi:hypothetical protein